jgi:hypothetical protein
VERAAAGAFTPFTFEPPITIQITCGDFGVTNRLQRVPGTQRLDNRVIASPAARTWRSTRH